MTNLRLPGPLGTLPASSPELGMQQLLNRLKPKRNEGPKIQKPSAEHTQPRKVSSLAQHSYVTVYIWVSHLASGSPGHAAIALCPGAETPEEGYVSFAPLKEGSPKGPGKFYDRAHDVKHYGNISQSSEERRGVWIANLYGLNVADMLLQLKKDLENVPEYVIPSNQCATTVQRYLQKGGGDDYASWWTRKVLGFWTPDDVEDYAESIADNTKKLGSNYKKYAGIGTLYGGSKEKS